MAVKSGYVFEPRTSGGPMAPGEELRFDLLLFGRAVDLQAYASVALEHMAVAGLGARRGRFRLTRLEAPRPDGPPQLLVAEGRASSNSAPASRPAMGPLAESPLTLRFTTPLRLRVRDRLIEHPTFRDLVFHMVRRTLELAYTHVPGARLDWSFQPLLAEASEIRTAASDLRWYDWERWSERQRTRMKLGGVVGSMLVEGDLSPFAALLRTAEVIHLGKGATFGLGKVELGAG